jgi:hypothetical protein
MAARWNRAPFNNDPVQAAFRERFERGRGDGVAPAAPAQPASAARVTFACTLGFPMLLLESPATFEALITPRQTSLVFSTREIRNIYTDGRKHTPDDEIWPTYWGDSIGHWDGATLVVDTTHVASSTITNNGLDHGENVHFVERFWLSADGKTLLARQEFEDPDTIENRGARNVAWDRQPGEHIYPYECDPTFVLNYGNKK